MVVSPVEYGKCLETGKRQNPLLRQNRYLQGAPNDLEYGKCLETGKMTNPLIVPKKCLTRGTERPFRCLDFLCVGRSKGWCQKPFYGISQKRRGGGDAPLKDSSVKRLLTPSVRKYREHALSC